MADIIEVHERTWQTEEGWSVTAILTDEGVIFDVRDENGDQRGSTYLFVNEIEERVIDIQPVLTEGDKNGR